MSCAPEGLTSLNQWEMYCTRDLLVRSGRVWSVYSTVRGFVNSMSVAYSHSTCLAPIAHYTLQSLT